MQMRLYHEKNSAFFATFVKSTLNFQQFETKDDPHTHVFSIFWTHKDVVG